MKTELIQLRISPEQKKALEAKAKKQGIRVSEVIRYLVENWLDR